MSIAKTQQTLKVTPIKLLFEKEFFVILATSQGIVIKGELLEAPKNLLDNPLVLMGRYENHPRYGSSFAFTSYEKEGGDLFHFLTTLVKGISRKVALSMVERFGDDLANVIENHPYRLLEISGIKEKKLEAIVAGWNHFSHLKHIASFLTPHGISHTLIHKIYGAWGDHAIEILTSDPYRLTHIHGIGFRKADDIARKLSVQWDDPQRIQAGLIYTIDKLMSSQGHTLVKHSDVVSSSIDILALEGDQRVLSTDQIEESIQRLIEKEEIVVWDHFLALKKFEMMERKLFVTLQKGDFVPCADDKIEDAWIDEYEKKEGIIYSLAQRQAIKMAATEKRLFLVAGYAGSGKSTVAKAILSLLQQRYETGAIIGCALSGVAANRIKQTTGFESLTIHSLLGFSAGGFTYHAHNKLPYHVILLDEASMVDSELYYRLIMAIDFETTLLVMMGDPAQLPPVGVGGIFSTLVTYNVLPCVILDKIYRQSEDQAIIALANEVRQGVIPPWLTHKGFSDFVFLQRPLVSEKGAISQERINDRIVESIVQMGKKIAPQLALLSPTSWEFLTYFQLLSPMREGVIGVKNLNAVLQPLLNPVCEKKNEIKVGEKFFREGDKVIHLSNKNMKVIPASLWQLHQEDSDDLTTLRRVYNGQIGVIIRVDEPQDEIVVFYPQEAYYVFYGVRDLVEGLADHAFAMTIHKSQGSEFANVVFVMSATHALMHSSKLIYTALTRAKKKLVVVGQVHSFRRGIMRQERYKRETLFEKFVRMNDQL